MASQYEIREIHGLWNWRIRGIELAVAGRQFAGKNFKMPITRDLGEAIIS